MTGVEDTVYQYREMVYKTLELRELLAEKMERYDIIDDYGRDNFPFSHLIQLITPQSMRSITQLDSANIPVYTDYFDNRQEIKNFINITSDVSTNNLTIINIYLIKRIQFYCNYLKAQLTNMGIDESLLKKAKTLKDYILLLSRVDRLRKSSITYEGEQILYTYTDNFIIFTVYDDEDAEVHEGTLKILREGETVPTIIDLEKSNVYEKNMVSLNLIERDPITYYVEYTGGRTHMPVEPQAFTFEVRDNPLQPSFKIKNMTETSDYYNIDSEDDFDGYMEDEWTVSVNIKDARGLPVGEPIPFIIYLQDKDHILYQGVTDSNGDKVIHNFNIPYYSSDFIDFETDKRSFVRLEEPITIPLEEAFEDLHFVKNIRHDDQKIAFDRVYFSEENYLDDLNGCIKDIFFDDGQIYYTEFQSDKHIPIKDLEDPREELSVLVNEIVWLRDEKNDITHLGVQHFGTQMYEEYEDDRNLFMSLILETQAELEHHPNDTFEHEISIYHHPIKVHLGSFEWYAGTDDIPDKIMVSLYDEYSGQRFNFFDMPNTVLVNDDFYCTVSDYCFAINTSDIPLDYGENDFNITFNVLNMKGKVTNSHTLMSTITLLSNFEIPNKTTYFYEGPEIYYKPKGKIGQGYQAIINGTRYTTNAQGLLSGVINDFKELGNHTLSIAGTNNIDEERYFAFSSIKPFEVVQREHRRTAKAVYDLYIYDKDHVTWSENNAPTLESLISNGIIDVNIQAFDNTNQTPAITNPSSLSGNAIIYTLTITPTTHTSGGDNTLQVDMRGYTYEDTFELYSKLFEWQSSKKLSLGDNVVKIKVSDPDIQSITIKGPFGNVLTANKENNIFTANIRTEHVWSTNDMIVTDGVDSEFFTISVERYTTTPSFNIDPSGFTFDYGTYKQLSIETTPAPINRSFSALLYIEEDMDRSITMNIPLTTEGSSTNVSTDLFNELKPGNYTLKLIPSNNDDDIYINNIQQAVTINKIDPNIHILSIYSAFDETNTPK